MTLALALALAADFDLLILNGRVIDGSNNPWRRADVGVRGDSIAAIGNLKGRTATRTLDATNLVVAPGFIDIHNHGRTGIFEIPTAENFLRQGVTTLLEGNDGSSPLPLAPYMEKLAARRISVNMGFFVGHGSVRQDVLELAKRNVTPDELAKMRVLVDQAMREGAFGLSTGLFYVPGNFAPTEEVIELAKVVAKYDGMHISHMRDEAADILKSVAETIRIGEEGGIPTQVSHHKVIGSGNWGLAAKTVEMVEQARARGVDVTIDQYPYTASSTGLAALFPQWALEGGRKAVLERLSAPETRARIKAVIVEKIKNDRGGGDPKNVVIRSCSFDSSLAGKTLADVTKARGRQVTFENAAETALEMQKEGGCSCIYHAISEPDIERIMRSPYTMIASDGAITPSPKDFPHPREFGTFARVLGRYVRERQTLRLEEAIWKMSGLPATRLKLKDRGYLVEGMKADLGIFDPATVADKAEFENPRQMAVGFRHVIVNGEPVILDGQVTAARPGKMLRHESRGLR
ncbi:MAG: D-aminoacylase [Bryobacteraceae bacterium]|nr:D-aminoacylase [Bryobacteraceae bacterium]